MNNDTGAKQPQKDIFLKPFHCDDGEARARLAALLPGGEVTCRISHRAYHCLVDFDRRGGPEPKWLLYQGWNHELCQFNDEPEQTPQERAEEEAAFDRYYNAWTASLEERDAQIVHALCAAFEDTARERLDGLPSGGVRFRVPADLREEDPPVEMVAWCEPKPGEERSVCVVIACPEEV